MLSRSQEQKKALTGERGVSRVTPKGERRKGKATSGTEGGTRFTGGEDPCTYGKKSRGKRKYVYKGFSSKVNDVYAKRNRCSGRGDPEEGKKPERV